MTLKVMDAGGVVRTITAIKVMDAGGVIRTISSLKMKDATGTVREVFTAGGGGGSTPNPAYITPADQSSAGRGAYGTGYFTAQSSTSAPTVYAWGVLDGNGTVISGAAAQTATLRVFDDGGGSTATFYCDMTIGGTVFRATCTLTRFNTLGGGTQ